MGQAQAVPGWCDFADLYAMWLRRFPETATIVEVGSYVGASALAFGELARRRGTRHRLICLDTWAGVPRACFADPAHADQQDAWIRAHGSLLPLFRQNTADVAAWLEPRTGHSLEAVHTFADASVDAVFLDDDHDTAHVAQELRAWWPKVRPGGYLAGHDGDWPSVQAALRAWAVKVGVPVLPASERSWLVRKPASWHWEIPPAARVCLVAVCCNERTVPAQTAESLAALGWGAAVLRACESAGFADVQFQWFKDQPRVDGLREVAALAACRRQASHLLFLDADMTWPADVLVKMLAHHNRGIVSGRYHLKAWPHWPVALKDGRWNAREAVTDYYYDEGAQDGTALRPEELVGLGCALIPTDVFRVLPRPWFDYRRNALTGLPTITEDVPFCEAARAHGVPVWLDPTIACGHVANPVITGQTHARAMFDRAWLERNERPPLPHELSAEECVS